MKKNWLDDLHDLERFEIRRYVKPGEFGKVVSAQLHHFSDDSGKGYGVVSYLLLHNQQGFVHSALLMNKSCVAPFT